MKLTGIFVAFVAMLVACNCNAISHRK